ncbi:MAG: TIGR03118 family protein [Pyrinomonadaceae bacterium]
MRHFTLNAGRAVACLVLAAFFAIALLPVRVTRTVSAQDNDGIRPEIILIAPGSAYRQTNFISDIPGLAPVQDPLLVNPWGISATASSPFWIANAGTSTTQLIRGDNAGAPVVLNASPQTITIPGGLPTGTVANNVATEFVLPGACAAAPCGANFLFASITGNITGWDPNAPAAGSTTAVIAASHPGHVYTGLALANNGVANFLYAADFATGRIDVFNSSFVLQPLASFPFADPTIPTTMGNTYHPYNIQNIGGSMYVLYAKVDPITGLDEPGVGNGFVRRFNANGVRDLTFGINNGALNSPWGIVLAPGTFGIFGGSLLVGNFGRGNPSIHSYNPTTGAFLGTLQNEAGDGIVIDGLWALQVGNGGNGGDVNAIYFAAGPAKEEHGLFGSLRPTTASATSLVQFATDDFTIGEGAGHIDVTVIRAGDASGTATVNLNTMDESQPGHASQKSDYEIALTKLTFNPGETSKTMRILVVNDSFVEGNETVNLALSNPTGAGVGLGSPNVAEMTITDNDVVAPVTNPIDTTSFFVRQQYLDFLNREPDVAGLAFWVNNIDSCGGNAQCREVKRIDTSAAFFLSIEFQKTGLLSILANKAAFGASASGSPGPVLYGTFEKDTQQLQKDLVFGTPTFDAQLEANKTAYFDDFVNRPEFVFAYSGLTNAAYVDALLTNAGITPAQVRLFVVNVANGQEVPPTVPTLSGGGARPASFGTARFQFNAAQTTMTMSATINNIDVENAQTADTNDNLAAAHIHAGAAVAPGVNGPVVWGFFGAPFNDNNPNDSVNTPFSSGVGGTFIGKWDAPEGNATTLAAQLSNLREGRAYINFHTVQFGGGEIRGNFPAADAFRNSLVAGLNSLTLTRAQVLRAVAESEEFALNEANRNFVLMEYFAYLRRDPDTAGFNFWLNKLNLFNGNFRDAEMVKAFLSSAEYRQRFGP